MIPVTPQPPPGDFEEKVRNPGRKFLAKYPNPTKDDWNKRGKKIWAKCSVQLRKSYNNICAYSAEWVPSDEKSIDHFIPRSQDKTLAFEWGNFRLCLAILNQYKSSNSILDPFKVYKDWFVIDFVTNLVLSNKELDKTLRIPIDDTINILKLNDFILQQRRIRWINAYCKGSLGIPKLKKKAPFIAYELERQGYEEKIKVIHEKIYKNSNRLR